MRYHPDIHHRRSIRLKDYDYSQAGAYFITICTKNRECLFGSIVNGEMLLSAWGVIVKNEWLRTSIIRPNIVVDEFVLMPNHLHGILVIVDTDCRGTLQRAPTVERFGKPTSNSIPTIVRLFKSTATKQINELRKTPGEPLWQRNYYERIIRNERELERIRKYVINDPLKWSLDIEDPERQKDYQNTAEYFKRMFEE
ncbi:MAG: REP-associated tyrosine transposase [Candidatus Atribacteria bacterium]|jgi:REP element-mobilizing transposase RayT|uniref:Transposase n=1 Tax=Thermatribacter velox TaxID=3039681 RepID=A0ABZ2Y955_9BACT|nr:REP-associated tyrosine transposase [Candidatus Atribacteria bacterium]